MLRTASPGLKRTGSFHSLLLEPLLLGFQPPRSRKPKPQGEATRRTKVTAQLSSRLRASAESRSHANGHLGCSGSVKPPMTAAPAKITRSRRTARLSPRPQKCGRYQKSPCSKPLRFEVVSSSATATVERGGGDKRGQEGRDAEPGLIALTELCFLGSVMGAHTSRDWETQ